MSQNPHRLDTECGALDPAPGSIADPSNDAPAGYLLKAGEGGMLRSSSLKRRWFALDVDEGVLRYYKSEGVMKPSGEIPYSSGDLPPTGASMIQ